MMRAMALLVAFTQLAACGVDGPPLAPAKKTPALTMTGEASFGIAKNGTN